MSHATRRQLGAQLARATPRVGVVALQQDVPGSGVRLHALEDVEPLLVLDQPADVADLHRAEELLVGTRQDSGGEAAQDASAARITGARIAASHSPAE